jgi:hypothetical protein
MATAAQQLKEIKGILNLALAPTIRIEKDDVEYPMTEAERVQWVVNELKDKQRELDNIAEDAAGEDL